MVLKIGWANCIKMLNALMFRIGDKSFVSSYMRKLYRWIRKTKYFPKMVLQSLHPGLLLIFDGTQILNTTSPPEKLSLHLRNAFRSLFKDVLTLLDWNILKDFWPLTKSIWPSQFVNKFSSHNFTQNILIQSLHNTK